MKKALSQHNDRTHGADTQSAIPATSSSREIIEDNLHIEIATNAAATTKATNMAITILNILPSFGEF